MGPSAYILRAGEASLISFAAVKALTVPWSRVRAWWIRCRFPFLFTFAWMYTKQEASRLRQEFWTAFGQYMALSPSTGGEKANWLNYKTGVRYLNFKME